jgi:hypothetical protein
VPAKLYIVAAAIASVLTASSAGQGLDDTLLPFAVNIHRTPVQAWPGYGIYLGRGLVLTAAHVVGRGWWTRPKVVIGGVEFPTRILKEGSFEGTDLTLLGLDEKFLPMRMRLRRTTLCEKAPWPGEPVVTVVPESVARSYILSPDKLPKETRRFSTVIADVATTGNSGSGVFDERIRCLLGIMSRKISVKQPFSAAGKPAAAAKDIAKYFVPASEIKSFLPTEARF